MRAEATMDTEALARLAADVASRFAAANPASRAAFERASAHMPGADTRSVLHYAPFPVTIVRGEAQKLWDLDGHEYTDFLGDYTAGLHGHSDSRIREALHAAIAGGLRLGGPHPAMHEMAELLCKRFPAIERVRFANSGTEANVMAVSAARVATGRDGVMVFEGAYHGGVIDFTSDDRRLNLTLPWVIGRFNDVEGAAALIAEHAEDLAAVLVEPMLGGGGAIPGDPAFLHALRDATSRHGIPLIFDEVVTSRLAPGGVHGELGIRPDLVTFGKYLGGGASFGAFGGSTEIMGLFDPTRAGSLHHSGTSNNNVLTMSAGLAGFRDVYTEDAIVHLNERGDRLRHRLRSVAESLDAPVQVTGRGSVMNVHFQRTPIVHGGDPAGTPPAARVLFHMEMLLSGFYVASRGLMSLSLAITDKDCAGLAEAFGAFLETYRAVLNAEA